jgi:hypothetical protein
MGLHGFQPSLTEENTMIRLVIAFLLSFLLRIKIATKFPALVRRSASDLALWMSGAFDFPIFSGGLPINGAQVILRLDESPDPVDLAYQKDVSFDTTVATIPVSNKTSGPDNIFLAGRIDRECTLSMFFSDDSSYQTVRAACDARTRLTLVRAYDSVGDGASYDNVESADCFITKLGEKFADQEGAMADVTFKVSGPWTSI